MMPTFEILYPESGLQPRTIEAYSTKDALEKFADNKDCDWDYTLLSGNTMGFLVREQGSKNDWEYFEVRGETVPSYNAIPEERPNSSGLWKKIIEYIEETA